nr:MAG TPA: hypothetical protein [Caudoviricetes sp.]
MNIFIFSYFLCVNIKIFTIFSQKLSLFITQLHF